MATLRCSLSQALRLYVYPYFRPADIDPATTSTSKDTKAKLSIPSNKKTRSPSPKNKEQGQSSAVTDLKSKKKSSTTRVTEAVSELPSVSEPIEERPRPALQLQQLNTIIFGLPNLTFAP